MKRHGRAIAALAVGIGVIALILLIFSSLGAAMVWLGLDAAFPTVSGQGSNTNTNFWGRLLLLPLCVAAGLVAGALVWDPKVSSVTETVLAIVVFIILGSVSGVNFWSKDTLINVNGQMVIDFVLSISSLVIIGLLMRWKPSLLTATAIQRVVLFLVTLFGFVLPLYYGTSLLLIRLGYDNGLGELSAWVKFVGAVLGLAAALAPNLKTPQVQGK